MEEPWHLATHLEVGVFERFEYFIVRVLSAT